MDGGLATTIAMKPDLRSLIAAALYPTKSYNLPAVCERYGLATGEESEAFSSKTKYVKNRLDRLPDDNVVRIAQSVVKDHPHDELQAALEQLDPARLISEITRRDIAKALDAIELGGKLDLLEFLRKHWPAVDHKPSYRNPLDEKIADDIVQHVIRNNDWDNSYVLDELGFYSCSQAKLFAFIEDLVHPVRRDHTEQEQVVRKLNPILRRDGYCLSPSGKVSGYPVYAVRETTATGAQPADELISRALVTFDEGGVHHAWQKALDRRVDDPEGAITAAKTLLETVCKHIIDDAGGTYGDNDDLPKLYALAAEQLNLAPSQHSETVFKAILGNCQAVVGNLAGLRNKLGDSHGQGKRHVKPQARHAELAVNLAGSVATFLASTWAARQRTRQQTEPSK